MCGDLDLLGFRVNFWNVEDFTTQIPAISNLFGYSSNKSYRPCSLGQTNVSSCLQIKAAYQGDEYACLLFLYAALHHAITHF